MTPSEGLVSVIGELRAMVEFEKEKNQRLQEEIERLTRRLDLAEKNLISRAEAKGLFES